MCSVACESDLEENMMSDGFSHSNAFAAVADEIARSAPKGVLLDLDDTLYAYGPCHAAGLRRCHERFTAAGGTLSHESFCDHYGAARERVKETTRGQAASHSRLLYFQRLLEGLGGRTHIGLTLELETAYWGGFICAIELRPGAREFLETLRRLGIHTAIVTDLTARIQLEKLDRMGLAKLVDFVVSSEEAGADKPAPAIFLLALQKLGMKPDEVVLIGDDADRDGRGGTDLGIRTVIIDK